MSMPGQRLVAAGQQHGAVDALGLHDGFDGVGDDFAGHQGEVHALVAHGDAVRDGDGAELHREPAAGVHAFLGALGKPVQGEVAGSDFIPGARDADLGLGEVVVTHADRPEHPARGRGVDSVGDDPAAGLDVRFGVCRCLGVLTHGSKSRAPPQGPTTRIGALSGKPGMFRPNSGLSSHLMDIGAAAAQLR